MDGSVRARRIVALALAAFATLQPVVARAALANDHLVDAMVIGALPAEIEQSTVDATLESEERTCAAEGATVWFSFTAAADTDLIVDTYGSDFDTVLAIYRGASYGDLRMIACSDDYYSDRTSAARVGIAAGTRLLIQVGGYATTAPLSSDVLPASGNLELTVWSPGAPQFYTPPLNDDLTDAAVVPSLPYTHEQYIDTASIEVGEPDRCLRSILGLPTGTSDVTTWYRYTSPRRQALEAWIYQWFNAGYLGVYEETASGPAFISCSGEQDDIGDFRWLRLDARAGATYLFQVISDPYYQNPIGFGIWPYPDGDLSVEDLTVSPHPGLVTQDSRRISFDIVLTGPRRASTGWIVETCSTTGPLACYVLSEGEIDLIADDRGRRSIDVDWTPGGCVGDVTVRVRLRQIDITDLDGSNDMATTQTEILTGGTARGVCPVHGRI